MFLEKHAFIIDADIHNSPNRVAVVMMHFATPTLKIVTIVNMRVEKIEVRCPHTLEVAGNLLEQMLRLQTGC